MFGNGKILTKLNKIDKCTALHAQEMGHFKNELKEHKTNDNEWKKEVIKKVGICSELNNVKNQGKEIEEIDKKVIAINTKQKIYTGILLVILSGIIGSFFWIVRSSL
jgi:hypothetical protein